MGLNGATNKDEDLSRIHHDLRGCLFTLAGGVRILRQRGGTIEDHAEVIRYMEESGKKAEELLAELIAYKRQPAVDAEA